MAQYTVDKFMELRIRNYILTAAKSVCCNIDQ